MTLKELSQLYWLNKEIEADEKRLKELRELSQSPAGAAGAEIPQNNGEVNKRVERMASEIVDLEALIAAKLIQRIHEQARLERYIADITDSLTRQIFTHRFIDGKTWLKVARCIGGDSTSDSVRMRCTRYIQRNNENHKSKRRKPRNPHNKATKRH